MLIETKTITELSLSFGNTWVVISATVMGILIMAYLANLSVIKIRIIPTILIYLLLTITLLAGAFLSDANLTFLPFGLNRILKTLILTAPIFFSGMAFSSELEQRTQIPSALSANLLGLSILLSPIISTISRFIHIDPTDCPNKKECFFFTMFFSGGRLYAH